MATSVDHIRYDLIVREAMRGVVRRVIADAAKNGLPGDHHFFVSFNTRAPGVRISPRLREQHPEEMTIVLQHQFWDLTVNEEGLEVGLSFNGVPERLVVPFDALKGFFDPSVQFGLEFEPPGAAEGRAESSAPTSSQLPSPTSVPAAGQASARKGAKRGVTASAAREPENATDEKPAPIKQDGGGAEVVRLDRFRKK
jgi:hypothetical protein